MGNDRALTADVGQDETAPLSEQLGSVPAASSGRLDRRSLGSAPLASGGVLLYKVADAARILNISRTLVFEQLRTGRLASVKQGRIRLIPATALLDYVELLVEESREAV